MSKKKLLAVLTGMVMAFMGLAGVGAASAAAPNTLERQPDKASLTVHKYMGATTSLQNNGTAITDGSLTGKTALKGVKFNLYKVKGVDISKNDGIKVAREISEHAITVNAAKTEITVNSKTYSIIPTTNPASAVTDADGTAKFPNQDRGLYVVVEDLEGSGTITGGGKEVKKEKITPIAPFALTLPMTNPDGKGWNTDVHVYPKNQVDDLKKEVSDENAKKIGDEFSYTLSVTSTPTDSNKDGQLTKADLGGVYEFYDELPANVEYVGTTATIAGANQTENTDFKVTTDGNKITVAFQGDALDKIAKGVEVKVKITVKLKSFPDTGLTKNTGKLYPNKWKKDKGDGTPSNEVITKHGDIVIKKINGDGSKNLAGAIFTVHLNTAAAKDCSTYGEAIATSKPTKEDGNDKGYTKIEHLQLTNWHNNAAVAKDDQQPYCLVEKQAPKGYQLLPKAIPFTLTKEGTVTDLSGAITANAGNTSEGNAYTIKNYKNPGLPLTGAQGILLVSALGLILVSIGVVLTVKRRKD